MPIIWRHLADQESPGLASRRDYRGLDQGQSLSRLESSVSVRHYLLHRAHIATAAANRQLPLRRAGQTSRVFARPPSEHVRVPGATRRAAAVDTAAWHPVIIWRRQRVEPSEAASRPAAASRLQALAWRAPPIDAPGRDEAARSGLGDSPVSPKRVARRAPELVWRAPAKTSPGPFDERAGAAVTGTVTPMQATSFRAGAASQTEAIVKAQPAPFEASIMDRLAEDVIRRVERRVRIDRERRGI